MRAAVVGLGVMGGSLIRALGRMRPGTGGDASRRDDASGHRVDTASEESLSVVGWAADPADRAGVESYGLEIGRDLDDTLRGADLVVLATPLSTIPDLASAVAGASPVPTIVMDVASLQEPAVAAARDASLADRWVSAHPMVGSERSGFGAARADLYDGARVFLSADSVVPRETRDAAVRFWARLDAVPEWIAPGDHDDRMATVSHLPQMVATALADTISGTGLAAEALGPGGRDTTRLAGSSIAMWRDLLTYARPTLVEGLRDLAGRLEEDASALEKGEVGVSVARLERAGEWRRGR